YEIGPAYRYLRIRREYDAVNQVTSVNKTHQLIVVADHREVTARNHLEELIYTVVSGTINRGWSDDCCRNELRRRPDCLLACKFALTVGSHGGNRSALVNHLPVS